VAARLAKFDRSARIYLAEATARVGDPTKAIEYLREALQEYHGISFTWTVKKLIREITLTIPSGAGVIPAAIGTVASEPVLETPPAGSGGETPEKGKDVHAVVAEVPDESLARRAREKRALLQRVMKPPNVVPFVKKSKSADAEEEPVVHHIDRKTEHEVVVERERCLVCDKVLVGTTYICPGCETKYCIRCAKELSSKGETCWKCKHKFDINLF
jgi:hypothetical protein